MTNQDIRQAAAESGVKLWMIAEALGMADYNFSRKLRRELPDADKAKIHIIISELSREADDGNK